MSYLLCLLKVIKFSNKFLTSNTGIITKAPFGISSIFSNQFILSKKETLNFEGKTNLERGTNLEGICKSYTIASLKYNNFSSFKSDKISKNEKSSPPCKHDKWCRFKELRRLGVKFWYIIIPVHLITSALWIFGIYYFVKNNKNIEKTLIGLKVPKEQICKMKNSWLGNFAIVAIFMKILAPIRAGVTLTFTTITLKILKHLGHLHKIHERQKQFVKNTRFYRKRRKKHQRNYQRKRNMWKKR